MLVEISKQVIEKYPLVELGYVVAKLNVKRTDDFTESLKARLLKFLNENNINEKNYSSHAQVEGWRKVYKDFGLSHKTNRSSVEALVKRIVTGSKMFNISNVVDLYNCCSVLSFLPMGGYDLDKIKKNIYIRYGMDNDQFDPLGSDNSVKVENKHVVYADEERVICWLWNYRDSKHTCISESTKHAIFFLDSAFEMKHISMKDAVKFFEEGLANIGAEVTSNGILSKHNPKVVISFENPIRTIESGEVGLFDKILEKKTSMNVISGKPSVKKQETEPLITKTHIPFVPLPIEKLATASYAVHCAATGNLESLKSILHHDKSLIDAKDSSKCTLVMHAVVGDHDNVLSFLLELNPKMDLKCQNEYGETVFDLAEKRKSTKSLSILSSLESSTLKKENNNVPTNEQAVEKKESKTINKEVVKNTISENDSNEINHEVYNSVCSLLNENQIEYHIEEHPPPYTCPSEGKAILMKIDESFHLFAYTASRKINSKLIKKHFSCKKMRFATKDELFDKLKLVPGSVPTLGEPILPVKIFLDKQMIENNSEITLSMGSVSHYAVMKMSDYLRITKYETFEFTDA